MPGSSGASTNWPRSWATAELSQRAALLADAAAAIRPEDLAAAADRELRRRLDRFLTGIERYRHHPYRRSLPDMPAVWSEGTTRLLDYAPGTDAPAVLFVPSLVNRGYILDLSERKSLLRYLAGQGLRPLLIDWDRPGPTERGYDLDRYVGRLGRALDAALPLNGGRPVPVVGYCMGGTIAMALAQSEPERVGALVAMAAPWDFHAERAAEARRAAGVYSVMAPWVKQWGEMPTDLVQFFFALLDPMLAAKKFAGFAGMAPDSEKARDFVALEDWLNDGVPLAAPVADEALAGWYGRNAPACGNWRVGGQAVDPRRIGQAALLLIPANDRIVPPASAAAAGIGMARAERREVPLGHIGMIVAGGAPAGLWAPLAAWLRGQAQG
ncbi:MAG TPA: alpha/beta fold hydrolase [Alphaproteobacteria bacterium]|nr:alpha/beta fold hydrolase [Alphaproteobacteria bacterium]